MKKHTNKAIAAILAAVLSLSLAACGDSTGSETTDSAKDTTAASAGSEESSAEAANTENKETEAPAAESTSDEQPDEAPVELGEENPPVEAELKSPVLKEIGTLDGNTINFYNKTCLFKGETEEEVECLNYMGEPIADGDVHLVEKLDDTGVYAYCKVKDDVIYEGLIDAEGNVIIDADQGVGIYRDMASSRFIKAYFPEGETTDENEAIYYVTSNQFSFMPKDSDTLYKGTVKVFDLETKKFLENTACKTDPLYSVNGDIISFFDADNNHVYVKADDTKMDIDSSTSITGEKFLVGYESGENVIYDHDMKKLFSTKNYVYELTDSPYYYRLRDNDSSLDGVMSAMGRTLIEPKYKSVYGLSDTYLAYSNGDNRGLLSPDGTEITKDIYTYITETVPGYFTAKRADDGVLEFLDKTGKVIFEEKGDDKLYSMDDNTPYVMKGGEYLYLVYGTGEFSLKVSSSGEYFGNNILYSYQDKAIYDLVTGEVLLDGFDKAYSAYGKYVYTLTGDQITVYEVQ